jgi:hypothetical protein
MIDNPILKEKIENIIRIVIFDFSSKFSNCKGLYTLLIEKTEKVTKEIRLSNNFFGKIKNSLKIMNDFLSNETNDVFEIIKDKSGILSKEILEIVHFATQIPDVLETHFKHIENYVLDYDENNIQMTDITFLETQKNILAEFLNKRNDIYQKIQDVRELNGLF